MNGTDLALIERAVQETLANASRSVPVTTFRMGTVVGVEGALLSVVVDGDDGVTSVVNATSLAGQVGGRVLVMYTPPQGVVAVGRIPSGGEPDYLALIDALAAQVAALPKGIVARATSAAQYTAISGATIVCTTGAVQATYVPGRRYTAEFTIYGANQTDTSSRFNLGFENAASVTYGEQWIGRFLQQASTYTWSTDFTVPATIAMGVRVRASRRDGSGTATFFLGGRNDWSTRLIVRDEGPA